MPSYLSFRNIFNANCQGISYASDFSIHCPTNANRSVSRFGGRGPKCKCSERCPKGMLQFSLRYKMQSARRQVLRIVVPTASVYCATLQVAFMRQARRRRAAGFSAGQDGDRLDVLKETPPLSVATMAGQ